MFTKRTKKVIAFGLLLYLVVITAVVELTIIKEGKTSINVDSAIYMFTMIQPGGFNDFSLITLFTPLLLIPAISSFNLIFLKNNNALSFVITRIGYKKYLLHSLYQVFCVSMLISLVSVIYQLILINWTYAPLTFSTNSFLLKNFQHFSLNSFIHLVLYLLTSITGWGIFSLLVFACGLYINKNVIYLVAGPIIGLICILLPALMGVGNQYFINLIYITNLTTLIAPGLSIVGGQAAPLGLLTTWVICACIYLSIIYVLLKLWRIRKVGGN